MITVFEEGAVLTPQQRADAIYALTVEEAAKFGIFLLMEWYILHSITSSPPAQQKSQITESLPA